MFSPIDTNEFLKGKLIYMSSELAFDTLDRQTPGVSSVLVNYINIELSEDGEAVAIWGVSPQSSWQRGNVVKPKSHPGRLQFMNTFIPGVSIRATQPGDYWPVIYDLSTGWLRIGREGSAPDVAIEFLSGCVLGLRDAQICNLWLHPEFRDK
jgi:hypothetical protein